MENEKKKIKSYVRHISTAEHRTHNAVYIYARINIKNIKK